MTRYLLVGINEKLKELEGDSLDEFVYSIVESACDVINMDDLSYVYNLKTNIAKKMELLDEDSPYREDFFLEQIVDGLENYDGRKQEERSCLFGLIAFDNNEGGVRQFLIDPYNSDEMYLGHVEIGSGSDGADLYFSTKLQGLDRTNLSMEELLFFACNGYNFSTVNTGVGGIPKIAHVLENECKILSLNQSIALANLSGAYLSRHPNLGSVPETLDFIEGILEEDKENYERLSEKLEISRKNLQTFLIPYSSWQQNVNEKIFNKN